MFRSSTDCLSTAFASSKYSGILIFGYYFFVTFAVYVPAAGGNIPSKYFLHIKDIILKCNSFVIFNDYGSYSLVCAN